MGRVDQLCLGCCGERGTGDNQNNQKDSGMQEKMAELKPDLPAVLGLFLFVFSCFAIFVLPACSSLSSLLSAPPHRLSLPPVTVRICRYASSKLSLLSGLVVNVCCLQLNSSLQTHIQ